MKILIDIGHPAHVHLFKNFAWIMQKKSHSILFTSRDKEVAVQLLKAYKFSFILFGKPFKKIIGKLLGLIKFDILLLKTALKFKPNIFLSTGSMYAAQVAWLMRKPHITFEDTGNMEQIRLYLPFSDVILTSYSYKKKHGKKQIYYNGYHELAYLHPNYFKPDKTVFETLGVNVNELYIILRFVSWEASHDFGQSGLSFEMKRKVVKEFSKKTKVFISSESDLPKDLKPFLISVPPEKMHDILAYAALVIGESPTMAEEAAILGTPSICVSSWAGDTGVICDLEKYNLLYCFKPEYEKKVIEKGSQLLKNKSTKKVWEKNRQEMLAEKIDVTAFMVWFVENYPESADIMRNDPNYQSKFK